MKNTTKKEKPSIEMKEETRNDRSKLFESQQMKTEKIGENENAAWLEFEAAKTAGKR